MSRLLGALVLDRYAVVLLVELERSVAADLERFHVVSSDVGTNNDSGAQSLLLFRHEQRAMGYRLTAYIGSDSVT